MRVVDFWGLRHDYDYEGILLQGGRVVKKMLLGGRGCHFGVYYRPIIKSGTALRPFDISCLYFDFASMI